MREAFAFERTFYCGLRSAQSDLTLSLPALGSQSLSMDASGIAALSMAISHKGIAATGDQSWSETWPGTERWMRH